MAEVAKKNHPTSLTTRWVLQNVAETRWEGGGTRGGEKDHPTSCWTRWVLHNMAGTRWCTWGMAETRWEGGGTRRGGGGARKGEKDHWVVDCRRVIKTPNESLDSLGVA